MLVLPRRPRLLRPPLGTRLQLDRRHPLSIGINDLVLFGPGGGVNYADPAVQPTLTGTPGPGVGGFGPGLLASPASTPGTNFARLAPSYNIAAGDFTASVGLEYRSRSGTTITLFEKADGPALPNREILLLINDSGSLVWFQIGSSAAGSGSTGLVTGATYRITITRIGSNARVYVNGAVVIDTTNSSTTGVTGSTWSIGENRAQFDSTAPEAVFHDLMVWQGRGLTAPEVFRHYADPYALLEPFTWAAFGGQSAAASHSLTATGLVTGAPTLGLPVLRQNQVLAATGLVTGAPTLGKPALSQGQPLGAATGVVTGAPTLGKPALTEGPPGVAVGRGHRRRRPLSWPVLVEEAPPELVPLVTAAEQLGYSDDLRHAVEDAVARYRVSLARKSLAEQERAMREAESVILAAIEGARDADDEEAMTVM